MKADAVPDAPELAQLLLHDPWLVSGRQVSAFYMLPCSCMIWEHAAAMQQENQLWYGLARVDRARTIVISAISARP
jgi:hypothetical protein